MSGPKFGAAESVRGRLFGNPPTMPALEPECDIPVPLMTGQARAVAPGGFALVPAPLFPIAPRPAVIACGSAKVESAAAKEESRRCCSYTQQRRGDRPAESLLKAWK